MARITSVYLAALLAFGTAGCAVGPDFQRPLAPDTGRYTSTAMPAETASAATDGGQAQQFAPGQEVPAQWWTMFGSSELNSLVEAALQANPDLQAMEAALRVTRENLAAQRGAFFPSVDAEYTPSRQKIATIVASPLSDNSDLFTLHTAQLSVSYVPDVFGGTRRQVEAGVAQADVARFQWQAAYLTLTSNVVNAAIQEASLRSQIRATHDVIALSTRQLEAVRKQQRTGQVGAAEVAAQEATLAQAEATLPPLEKQLAQQRNLLAVLTGRLPSDAVPQQFEFESLTLPGTLPLSLPSRLVGQRPDIRAAEAQMHVASAQIGVATAARLPNITLTASLGSSSQSLSDLFTSGTGFWGISAGLMQPIFKGGMLLHQQRAAEQAYKQASAQYRSTVLTAYQNVADSLHAIEADARGLRMAYDAERAAYRSFDIAQQQWKAGQIGYPAVLLAEQTYRQASITLVQARANRYADTVALIQALGGDWWKEAGKDVANG
ncbi:efflux transporter outer membrane subunit [Cupriavidus basilensis]|uniref:efflux transporter outer membrane subunit n=1 Tax=Cupriavidus basilensis TaxID=68895 RepID=UPI000750FEB4|nr:efflux transporter outer membrane subunit [Cupriavidus basilensis]